MQPVEFLPALHQRLLGGAKCQGLLASPRGKDYKIDPRVKACESLLLYSLLSKPKCVIIPRIYSQAKGNSLPPREGTICNQDRDYHSLLLSCLLLLVWLHFFTWCKESLVLSEWVGCRCFISQLGHTSTRGTSDSRKAKQNRRAKTGSPDNRRLTPDK